MFAEAVSRKTLKALDLVAAAHPHPLPPAVYLAGGTAAALHLAHRYSYDLDFFTPRRFDAHAVMKKLKRVPEFRLDRVTQGTVLGFVGNIQFSVFFYQYPLLFSTYDFRGIAVADLRDIAAMKVAAISDRGKKRDFIDLYFILREGKITIEEAIHMYGEKFGVLDANRIHVIRSLCYFDEADAERMPRMIKNVSWLNVKKFFTAEQKKLMHEIIG